MSLPAYERLGAFYLGRRYDLEAGKVADEPLLYDAKDLTTHAVCVGMTGSGKTGLCVTLLEEAALDGIPAIAIDPKGDLGNLLLRFPKLQPGDFEPWIDPAEAATKGRTPAEHARWTADLWRKGLASWDQDGARIARLRDAAETLIYTPGSGSGLPLSVLRSFAAPPPAIREDADALRERVMAAVSGVLALVGVDVDPLRSREHILLSALVDRAWRAGRDLDLASLIREIQSPPFERLGVLELESFFPAGDRFGLAMALNNLLASPAFAAWNEGEPLEVARLLYTDQGRPRISVLSIAHLSEAERMFFVTLLLNEVVAWMRAQPGTGSLRALLYMDEVFGYFPPTANPPSKLPMLTLMKQARAYGLGVVLATQNPVDLDYKGLSNAGTWFLGRLQTERDKARVMEGLEGVATSAGTGFDRAQLDRVLAGLTSRVFLMNNVHEDEPTLFHTRWALSYLRGPLTREQIARLMREHKEVSPPAPRPVARPAPEAAPPATAVPAAAAEPAVPAADQRPVIPPEIEERFLPSLGSARGQALYRPALLGSAALHYANARLDVDQWGHVTLLAPLRDEESVRSPWAGAEPLSGPVPTLRETPEPGVDFAPLPAGAAQPRSYTRWSKMLASHLYRAHRLSLWRCSKPKLVSKPGETERDFRARLRQALHEERDRAVEKLRRRYAPKLARIQERIRRAEERIERERSQYSQQKLQTAVSIGATLLGALFGRKLGSVGNVGRATTAARGAGRAAREREDVARAEQRVTELRADLGELEERFEEELEEVRSAFEDAEPPCKEVPVPPRKSDLQVERIALVWTPWRVGADGVAEPDY